MFLNLGTTATYGNTALHESIENNQPEIALFLIEQGIDTQQAQRELWLSDPDSPLLKFLDENRI